MIGLEDILTRPDGFDEPDEPWHTCPRDKGPASEFQRQATVLATVRRLAPAVFVVAIPNGRRGTDWEKVRATRRGCPTSRSSGTAAPSSPR